jgi:RNA polymerase sigma-70 factor (ECF subfamily)
MLRAEPDVLPYESSGRESAVSSPRIRSFIAKHFSFVWRSLLRLRVPRADAEDALQQVFIVASRKLDAIEPGREQAFLFGVVLKIAAHARRTEGRRREVLCAEPIEQVDEGADTETLFDRARARATLDAILDAMPMDIRAVFVLFELERLTTAEIAGLLDLPIGTVASRLRRARAQFYATMARIAARRRVR